MTHEQRLGININWLINHRFNVTRKHSRYEDLTKIATWLRLWLSMKAGWSRYLGVSQYQGWLASRHLLGQNITPSLSSGAKQPGKGGTREILGLDLFYRPEVSYFAALMYWHSHKNGADEGKFKSGYNCAARGGCAAGCCYKVSSSRIQIG